MSSPQSTKPIIQIFEMTGRAIAAILRFIGLVIWTIIKACLYLTQIFQPCAACGTFKYYDGSCPNCEGRNLSAWEKLKLILGTHHICSQCSSLQPAFEECPKCGAPWPNAECLNCHYENVPLRKRCPVCSAWRGWYPFEQVAAMLLSFLIVLGLAFAGLIVLYFVS